MFWTRLVSGIILLIIAVGTMFVGDLPLLLVLLLCSLIAYRELTKALGCNELWLIQHLEEAGYTLVGTEPEQRALDKPMKFPIKANYLEVIGLIGVAAYYAVMYFSTDKVMLLMCIVAVFMAEMFCYVVTFPKYHADQVVAAVFAFLYAPLMLSFVYLTRMGEQGKYLVWLILISSWGCDTCAYVVGKLIGKKKIFPLLSPKKSLEGCIGGMLGAALIGGIYGYFVVEPAFPDNQVYMTLAFICAIGAVMSMVGDLAASAIKRNCKIKDYGNLIPGHGGIMDRFDSMTVTAPMVYFLALLMLG
ncbi:MAG: phosphatidate cytidylyltransferase [Lachnospiraceae bacterium]|nr:phosphatidate cytidylyltransferase [Lachnospiraceae bacterium]